MSGYTGEMEALVAVGLFLVTFARHRLRAGAPLAMGTMSEQWVAEYRGAHLS
jgi:hypothetical protein